MFIDNKAILHAIDTATRFSAAICLDYEGRKYNQSVEGIWTAFVMKCCTMYPGYPNRMRTDQGCVFRWDRWKPFIDLNVVQLRMSGVKLHSLRHHFPNISFRFVLRIAVKAIHGTIKDNGLLPSRLVFGIVPRFPILNTNLSTQKDGMLAIKTAQEDMHLIIAERRLLTALTINTGCITRCRWSLQNWAGSTGL